MSAHIQSLQACRSSGLGVRMKRQRSTRAGRKGKGVRGAEQGFRGKGKGKGSHQVITTSRYLHIPLKPPRSRTRLLWWRNAAPPRRNTACSIGSKQTFSVPITRVFVIRGRGEARRVRQGRQRERVCMGMHIKRCTGARAQEGYEGRGRLDGGTRVERKGKGKGASRRWHGKG